MCLNSKLKENNALADGDESAAMERYRAVGLENFAVGKFGGPFSIAKKWPLLGRLTIPTLHL